MRASTAEERHVVTLLKSSGSATTDVVNICNNGGCLVVSRLELADPAVSVDTNYGSELFRLTDVTDPVTAKEWGRKHDALMSVYVSAHQLLLVTE